MRDFVKSYIYLTLPNLRNEEDEDRSPARVYKTHIQTFATVPHPSRGLFGTSDPRWSQIHTSARRLIHQILFVAPDEVTTAETKQQIEFFLSLFGTFKLLVMDAGTNFKNSILPKWLEKLNINYHLLRQTCIEVTDKRKDI